MIDTNMKHEENVINLMYEIRSIENNLSTI